MHTGAVVDDPWNEELVRVGNMVFPNAEVRHDPRSQDHFFRVKKVESGSGSEDS